MADDVADLFFTSTCERQPCSCSCSVCHLTGFNSHADYEAHAGPCNFELFAELIGLETTCLPYCYDFIHKMQAPIVHIYPQSGAVYRCAFCTREFPNNDPKMFLDHMRACNPALTSGPSQPQVSNEEAESGHETPDTATVETDTRSETSSQQPRRRGRPPANAAAAAASAKRQSVFLNRSQSKPKLEQPKSSKNPVSMQPSKTPQAILKMPATSSAGVRTAFVMTDEFVTKAKHEILHGNLTAVVRIVQDPEIVQLCSSIMNNNMMPMPLPARYITKHSAVTPSFKSGKPHMKIVGKSSSNKAPNLECKHCGDSFSTTVELTSHIKYCASGFVVGGFDSEEDEDDGRRADSRGGHRVPEIPVSQQICNYCGKQFQFWLKLRNHLLRNCPDRRELYQLGKLPANDQLQHVENELAKKKQRSKEEVTHQPEMNWGCEYCKTRCFDRNELTSHLRRCKRRLELLEEDELLAHEDQLNKIKRIHVPRGGPIGRPPTAGRTSVSPARAAPIKRNAPRTKERVDYSLEKRYECPKCHIKFDRPGKFNSHMERVCFKQSQPTDTAECPGCQRMFPTAKALSVHMNQHCSNKQALNFDVKTRALASVFTTTPKQEGMSTPDLQQPGRPKNKNNILQKDVAFQGEDNLYVGDARDLDGVTDVSTLLEQLAGISPLGDDLFQKALHGAKLDIAPPPIPLRKGVQLVDVYDSNGSVFKVPYNTQADPQSALMEVVSLIGRRQRMSAPSGSTPQPKVTSQSRPTQQRPVYSRRQSISSDDDDEEDDYGHSTSSVDTEEEEDPSYNPRDDGEPVRKRAPPPPPLAKNVDEDFVASADWVRRQNQARVASGGRRVKVNTRYLE